MARPTIVASVRTYFPAGDRRISRHRIWTMGGDGSGARPITGGRFDDVEPFWLPGADEIVFLRRHTERSPTEVRRIGTDGRGEKRLATAPPGAFVGNLGVSRDGRWAAWNRSDPDVAYLHDFVSGQTRTIPGGSFPEWDDDGRLRLTLMGGGETGITVDPKTLARTPIDADRNEVHLPDGTVYGIEIAPDDDTALMLVEPDGSGHKIVPDARAAKALKTNDRELVHARYPSGIPGSNREIRLRTFDHRAYRTLHFRLDLTTRGLRFWFDSPGPTRLSPDGQWFYSFPYERYTRIGKLQVNVRNLYRTPADRPGTWTALLPPRTVLLGYDLR